MTSEYHHPHLYSNLPLPDGDSIRLLKISDRPFPAGTLNASLQVFPGTAWPACNALSYTWGTPFRDTARRARFESDTRPCEIMCNNLAIRVTRNLQEALLAFQGNPVIGFLWIDALCINQADRAEKAQQVQRMDKVYTRARQVLAWLGRESREDAGALEVINEFTPRLRSIVVNSTQADLDSIAPGAAASTDPDELFTFPRGELVRHLGLNFGLRKGLEDPRKHARACSLFFQRSWFHRVWIVQEATLNRQISVFCGQTSIQWTDIADFHAFVGWNANMIGDTFRFESTLTESPSAVYYESVTSLGVLRTRLHANNWMSELINQTIPKLYRCNTLEGRRYSSLVNQLHHMRSFTSQDPRDKAFANIGLINGLFPPENEEVWFRVDYHPPCAEIYRLAMTRLLEASSSLSCLSLVSDFGARQLEQLPSWVPDFTVRSQTRFLMIFNDFNASMSRHVFGTTCQVIGETLEVLAQKVDTIETLDEEPIDSLVGPHVASPEALILFHNTLEPVYKTGINRFEALWRTLLANHEDLEIDVETDEFIYPARDHLGPACGDWIMSMVATQLKIWQEKAEIPETVSRLRSAYTQFASALPDTVPSLSTVDGYIAAMPPGKSTIRKWEWQASDVPFDPDPATEFTQKCAGTCLQRRLFRTKSGYIGIARVGIQPGDEVWILQGADMPFILRRGSGSRFQLIADSYVHGVMHGEAIAGQTSEFLPIQIA